MLGQITTFVAANVARHQHKGAASLSSTTMARRCCGWAPNATNGAVRPLSSTGSFRAAKDDEEQQHVAADSFVVETADGKTYRVMDTRKFPKVKPSIVRKRLEKCKTYVGTEKNIRHSPWRLNLICQMIAGLSVPEALKQLAFSEKSRAPLVSQVLQKTVNLADIRHGLQPTQLEVAECFATKGTPLKRIKPMARGRHGKMERPHAHMRLVVREIDFKLRIYQQRSKYQKQKWLNMQIEAQEDAKTAGAERQELERIKARQQEIKDKEEEDKKK